MVGPTRRSLLLSGIAAARMLAEGKKGEAFASDAARYPDPLTEIDVYRLTKPDYSTTMTAYYNRGIARNSNWMLCCCDRTGTPQAFHLDLKNGRHEAVDGCAGAEWRTLTLTARQSPVLLLRRTLVIPSSNGFQPEGARTISGSRRLGARADVSVGPDGTHATLIEKRGETSRLRMVSLVQGVERTVIEAPFVMSAPIPRPMRAQILYRQGGEAVWLVNSDGTQNRKLKLAAGGVGTPNWSTDGRTVLYLNFPDDHTQLNNLREFTPDSGTDKMIGKTSQFAAFGANRDASVFVGASRNSSPAVLLLLRAAHSERTLCEHKASKPEWVAPLFSPDSQRIYFQSDRHGKPAIYSMHVEKLVEKTDA